MHAHRHLSSRRLSHLLAVGASLVASGAALGACMGVDPIRPASNDGGIDDAGTLSDADAVDPNRACDPAKAFGPPRPVLGLSTTAFAELGARFSPDEQTTYFARINPNGSSTVFMATRASADTEFGNVKQVSGAEIADPEEGAPSATGDGKLLFFESYDLANRKSEIWTRGMSASGPSVAKPKALFGLVNGGLSQGGPYVLPDGHALYFHRTANDVSRLYRAERIEGQYANVTPIAGLRTKADESDYGPVVTPDELTIYWSSLRGGSSETAIYVATRADTTSPFSDVRSVTELNANAVNLSPTFISADGCRLYFGHLSSGGGSYVADIYVADKPK